MKKLFTLVLAVAAIGSYSAAWAQSFDAKLKRFIMIEDNKYAPEVSRDEAIKLGFTVNDYNRFVQYVDSLNIRKHYELTLPQNRFLEAFVEVDPKDGTLVLAIPLEKALRAGATAVGYWQTLEVIRANDASLVNEEFTPKSEQAKEREKRNEYFNKYKQEMMEFAIRNPDSSAVQKFFTPPPMPKY